MIDIQQFIEQFKTSIASSVKYEFTGNNALTKNLFEFLLEQTKFDFDFLLLFTPNGLILSCSSPYLKEDVSGYLITPEFFISYENKLVFSHLSEEFCIVSVAQKLSNDCLKALCNNLKCLLSITNNNKDSQYLLEFFDAIDNAICIYDSNACLLYGNKRYLDMMQIHDREGAVGMHISDITKQSGIKIQATKNGSRNLKMLDVLKSGRKLLDWEVTVESQTASNKVQFLSNNMYPARNERGDIKGLIEVSSFSRSA